MRSRLNIDYCLALQSSTFNFLGLSPQHKDEPEIA